MAITIITDPVSLSVDENTSSRNFIDLGSLVLTDPRWAGLTFTLTSATDDDGNDVVGFSLVLVDGIYKIRYQRQVGLDAEEISTVTLNITSSDGTEIAPIEVQINDLNDTPPFFGEYITSSDSIFIYSSSRIPTDYLNKHYFQSNVDLINNHKVRHGIEGTGEIIITLLREEGVVVISSEIKGMHPDDPRQNYFVWAVRKNHEWSLVATHNTGDIVPPGYDEAQFLYVQNTFTNGFLFLGAERVPEGTTFLKKYPSTIVLNVREDFAVDTVIFTLPNLYTDTGSETVFYNYIQGGGTDSDFFSFDHRTGEIRLIKALDIPVLTVSVSGGALSVTGTSATELILGNQNNNIITTNGGDDLVVMGTGGDDVRLSSGAETVFYRFQSSNDPNGKSVAIDGRDFINNFELGKDKLVLVDTNSVNPFDTIGDFGLFPDQLSVSLVRSGQQIIGVELYFNEESTAEKAKVGIRKSLHIYFDASTYVTETEQTKWSGLINNGQSFENPGFLFQLFEETLDVVNVDDLPSQLVFL